MRWIPFENGSTIGKTGSEGGIIQRDEEHERGARITLEECGDPPFAITCAIYGVMAHTAFATTLVEATDAHEAMKVDLEMLLDVWPDRDAEEEEKSRFHGTLSAFADKY